MGGRAGTAVVLFVGVRMGLSARRVRRERRGPNYHAKSNWRRDEAGLGLLCPVLPLSRPRRRTRPSRMCRADGAEPGPECEVLCDVILEGAMSRGAIPEWVKSGCRHTPPHGQPLCTTAWLRTCTPVRISPQLPCYRSRHRTQVCLSTHSPPLKRRPLYHTSLLPHNM